VEGGEEQWEYLVVVDFEATCDEGISPKVTRSNQEVIEFPWVVIHVPSCQIVDKQQFYVRPEWSEDLTEFCTTLTGITNDMVRNAPHLSQVMGQFDEYVEKHFTSQHKSFCVLTDGDWDLKVCLLQETNKKKIERAAHYKQFFNLKEEFLKVFPSSHTTSLKGMLKELNLRMEGRHHSGLDDCVNIAGIVLQLIKRGHHFVTPNTVPDDYNPATDPQFKDYSASPQSSTFFPVSEEDRSVRDTKVVLLRGLPFAATEGDIVDFFRGLAIKEEGVHLIFNEHGKPSGIAYVEFKNPAHAKKALAKNEATMGTRYIEVFLSSKEKMDLVLASQKSVRMQPIARGMNVRPGDWFCTKCGDLQFASRVLCRKCGTKPE